MQKFDEATRRRLASAWKPTAETATEYARRVGVSERALRLWRSRLHQAPSPAVPQRHRGMPVGGDVDQLRARMAELEDLLGAALRAGAACRAAVESMAVCRDVPGGTTGADVVRDSADVVGVVTPPSAAPSAGGASMESASPSQTASLARPDGGRAPVDQGSGGSGFAARRRRGTFYQEYVLD